MRMPSPSDVQVEGAFPTPVVKIEVPDAVALNAELKSAILAHEQSVASAKRSNIGGWQSQRDIAQWGGAPCRHLIEIASRTAGMLTTGRDGKPVKIGWKVGGWANINRHGHANEFHTHPGCFWSGCYYVDDGGVAGDPAIGGAFVYQDPRGVLPAMYAPQLAFNLPGGQQIGASEGVRPHSGLMLMFPSWLSHGVERYLGPDVRISIAFNLGI